MRNPGLEEAQAGIKITGRNINHLRYADDTTLMAESEIKETIPFTIATKRIKYSGINQPKKQKTYIWKTIKH